MTSCYSPWRGNSLPPAPQVTPEQATVLPATLCPERMQSQEEIGHPRLCTRLSLAHGSRHSEGPSCELPTLSPWPAPLFFLPDPGHCQAQVGRPEPRLQPRTEGGARILRPALSLGKPRPEKDGGKRQAREPCLGCAAVSGLSAPPLPWVVTGRDTGRARSGPWKARRGPTPEGGADKWKDWEPPGLAGSGEPCREADQHRDASLPHWRG